MSDMGITTSARLEALRALKAKVEAGYPTIAGFRAVFEDFDEYQKAWAAQYSLDAALALHEAVLPGWMLPMVSPWHVGGENGAVIELWSGGLADDSVTESGTCLARTWFLAILAALIALVEAKQ